MVSAIHIGDLKKHASRKPAMEKQKKRTSLAGINIPVDMPEKTKKQASQTKPNHTTTKIAGAISRAQIHAAKLLLANRHQTSDTGHTRLRFIETSLEWGAGLPGGPQNKLASHTKNPPRMEMKTTKSRNAEGEMAILESQFPRTIAYTQENGWKCDETFITAAQAAAVHYKLTGEIKYELIPLFDQTGKWDGLGYDENFGRIEKEILPENRRTKTDPDPDGNCPSPDAQTKPTKEELTQGLVKDATPYRAGNADAIDAWLKIGADRDAAARLIQNHPDLAPIEKERICAQIQNREETLRKRARTKLSDFRGTALGKPTFAGTPKTGALRIQIPNEGIYLVLSQNPTVLNAMREAKSGEALPIWTGKLRQTEKGTVIEIESLERPEGEPPFWGDNLTSLPSEIYREVLKAKEERRLRLAANAKTPAPSQEI